MKKTIFSILILAVVMISGRQLTQEDPQLAMQMEIALPGGGGGGGAVQIINSTCLGEGEVWDPFNSGLVCCEGLEVISWDPTLSGCGEITIEGGVCTSMCGNGICDTTEQYCTCPEDCGNSTSTDVTSFTIKLDDSRDFQDEDNYSLNLDNVPVTIISLSHSGDTAYFDIKPKYYHPEISFNDQIDDVYFTWRTNEISEGYMEVSYLIYEDSDGYHFLPNNAYDVEIHKYINDEMLTIYPALYEGNIVLEGNLLGNEDTRLTANLVRIGEDTSYGRAYYDFGYSEAEAEPMELVLYNSLLYNVPSVYDLQDHDSDLLIGNVLLQNPSSILATDQIKFEVL